MRHGDKTIGLHAAVPLCCSVSGELAVEPWVSKTLSLQRAPRSTATDHRAAPIITFAAPVFCRTTKVNLKFAMVAVVRRIIFEQ
jgi:hypothetical protein